MEIKRKHDGTLDERCVKKKVADEDPTHNVDSKKSLCAIPTGKGILLPDPSKRGMIYCRESHICVRHCLFGYRLHETTANLNETAIFKATSSVLSFAICSNDEICSMVTKALLCNKDGTWPSYYFDIRHGENLYITAIRALASKAAELYGTEGKIVLVKEMTPAICMMANGLHRNVCQCAAPELDNEHTTIKEFRHAVKIYAQEVPAHSPLARIKTALLEALDADSLLVSALNGTGPGLWKLDRVVYATDTVALVFKPPAQMPLQIEQAVHVSLGESDVAVDKIVKVVRLLKGEGLRDDREERGEGGEGGEEEWSDMPYLKPGTAATLGQEIVSDEDSGNEHSEHSDLSFLAATLPDDFDAELTGSRVVGGGHSSSSAQHTQQQALTEADRLRRQITALNAKRAQSMGRLARLSGATTDVVDLIAGTGETYYADLTGGAGKPPSSIDTFASFITSPYPGATRSQTAQLSSTSGTTAPGTNTCANTTTSTSTGTGTNSSSHGVTSSLPAWMEELKNSRRPDFVKPTPHSLFTPVANTITPDAPVRRSSYRAPSTPTDSGSDSEMKEEGEQREKEEQWRQGSTCGAATSASALVTTLQFTSQFAPTVHTNSPTTTANTASTIIPPRITIPFTTSTAPATTPATTASNRTAPSTTTLTTSTTALRSTTKLSTPSTITTTTVAAATTTTTTTSERTSPSTSGSAAVSTAPTRRMSTRSLQAAQTCNTADGSQSDTSTTDLPAAVSLKRPLIQCNWVTVKKQRDATNDATTTICTPTSNTTNMSATATSLPNAITRPTATAATATTTATATAHKKPTNMPAHTTATTTKGTATSTSALPVPLTTQTTDIARKFTAARTTTTATNMPHIATTAIETGTPSSVSLSCIGTGLTNAPAPALAATSDSTTNSLTAVAKPTTTTTSLTANQALKDENNPLQMHKRTISKPSNGIQPLTAPIAPSHTTLYIPPHTTLITSTTSNTTSPRNTNIYHTYHAGTNIHMYTNSTLATERLVDFVELSLSEELQQDLRLLRPPVVVHRGVARPTQLPPGTACVELNQEPLSVAEFYDSVRAQLELEQKL